MLFLNAFDAVNLAKDVLSITFPVKPGHLWGTLCR